MTFIARASNLDARSFEIKIWNFEILSVNFVGWRLLAREKETWQGNTGSIIISPGYMWDARARAFVNFSTAAFAVAIIRRFDSLGRTQAYPIIRRFDSLGRTQAYHTPSPPPTIRRCIAMRERAVERRKFSQDGVMRNMIVAVKKGCGRKLIVNHRRGEHCRERTLMNRVVGVITASWAATYPKHVERVVVLLFVACRGATINKSWGFMNGERIIPMISWQCARRNLQDRLEIEVNFALCHGRDGDWTCMSRLERGLQKSA